MMTRRHVMTRELNPAGFVRFGCRSFSRDDARHELAVDLATGAVVCTCEHGRYRMGTNTTLADTGRLCVHAARARRQLIRKGLVKA